MGDGPDYVTRTRILHVTKRFYRECRWRIPDDFLTRAHYERALEQLEWQSSPGYPYMNHGTTNAQYFCWGTENYPLKVDEVWDIVQRRLKGEASDPIRLFIKPEPLKKKKLENKTYRLISSVSVVDQILDIMIFGDCNEALIANWYKIPNKAGWSPVGGGYRIMPRQQWMAIDKSKWDWSVKPWLLEMDLELRAAMCVNVSAKWLELASMRYVQLFGNPLFVTSGGVLLRQRKPGVMKSGCINTISSNSIMQTILHVTACLKLDIPVGAIYTMGDDTLQQPVKNLQPYLDELSKYCVVKHAVLRNEFAGFRYTGCHVEPLYKGKHAYKLLHMTSDKELQQQLCESYCLNYHRSVDRDAIRSIFQSLGNEPPALEFLDSIWDGFM